MILRYVRGRGMQVLIQGAISGFTILLPLTMSVGAIQNHLRELREFLDD